ATQIADHELVSAVLPLTLAAERFGNIYPGIWLVHFGLNRCDRAKRLSRKRVIALLDEVWRSTNLRSLEVWNPVRRPYVFALTLRVLGTGGPHRIGVARHAASVSETRRDSRAVRRHVGGSDQLLNPKPLPFHVQRFDRAIRIITEN